MRTRHRFIVPASFSVVRWCRRRRSSRITRSTCSMSRRRREIVLDGVVKEWNFTNPHSWLTITVTNPDGTQTDWSFEAAAAAALVPKGITINTYKVGDKVKVVGGPLKDGRKGGILKFVQHADGTYTLPNDAGTSGRTRWTAGKPRVPADQARSRYSLITRPADR